MSIAEIREKIALEHHLPTVATWAARRDRANRVLIGSLFAIVPVTVFSIRWELGVIATVLGTFGCIAIGVIGLFIYALSDRMVEAEIEVLRMKFERCAK